MSARTILPSEVWMLTGREKDAWFALASDEQVIAALKYERDHYRALLDEAALDNEAFTQRITNTQGI